LLNFSNLADRERLATELELLGRLPVPSRSSYFGIVDLAGFPKDRFFLYQARWRPELRMAHILPHWNWPERAGEVTPVHVYSSGDEAELFLNGRSLGVRRKKRFEYRFRWDRVVYEPGELKVRVKKRGKPWAIAARRTTGPATKLTLTADRSKLAADGSDLAFVTARITDAYGLVVPRANHRLLFSIRGPGLLVAVDNGDPTSHEPFQGAERNAFNGLALAVVRTTRRPGKIRLRVESEQLAPGEVSIESR
jgi:beta-galactosidase